MSSLYYDNIVNAICAHSCCTRDFTRLRELKSLFDTEIARVEINRQFLVARDYCYIAVRCQMAPERDIVQQRLSSLIEQLLPATLQPDMTAITKSVHAEVKDCFDYLYPFPSNAQILEAWNVDHPRDTRQFFAEEMRTEFVKQSVFDKA